MATVNPDLEAALAGLGRNHPKAIDLSLGRIEARLAALGNPERRLPRYRDWESRTQKARFDCAKAKRVLGWQPASERTDLIERGIALPAREWLA